MLHGFSNDTLAPTWNSLVELGRERACRDGDKIAYTFLKDGETEEGHLTFESLDRKARALAAELSTRGLRGERALLLYPSGLDFIVAFIGCLYAGTLPVPVYLPQARREHWLRLEAIANDCKAQLILGSGATLDDMKAGLDDSPILGAIARLASDRTDEALCAQWTDPGVGPDDLAFLQYTSGSTGTPKGVMVSHGNLLHNEMLMAAAFGHNRDTVLVSWLPLFHDMGLIGNVLHALYLGARCVLMSPVAFLQKPSRWLQAISDYRGHSSFAPNFAYELCMRRVTDEQRQGLDLSSWSFALNGAEPVRADTLKAFSDYFAPCGYAAKACYPGYGLAEATLFAAGGQRMGGWIETNASAEALAKHRVESPNAGDEGLQLVSSGRQCQDLELRVVDPDTRLPCPDNVVGEIWLRGPSVAKGYWQRPEATAETFQATISDSGEAGFLRTGDLGFMRDGAMYVTGRLKEVVIVRGRNHYPQDIEHTVQHAVPGLRLGGGAAFSVVDGGNERLVVVQEIERTHLRQFDAGAAAQQIRAAVVAVHEIPLDALVFIKPASLPKTSSGKIQRRECRTKFLHRELAEVASFDWEAASGPAPIELFDRSCLEGLDQDATLARLESDIQGWIAFRLGLAPDAVDLDRSLTACGLDSLRIVEFQHVVQSGLDLELSLGELISQPSLRALARVMAAPQAARADQRTPAAPDRVSDNQRSLWLEQQIAPASGAYNIVLPLRVRTQIDLAALEQALAACVDRHAQLRTIFPDVDGTPRAAIGPAPVLELIDASAWDEAQLRAQITTASALPFNLEGGPNFTAQLYQRTAFDQVLVLRAHHIIMDLWSMQLLLKELGAGYAALCQGRALPEMDPLPAYADYAQWQADWLDGPGGAAAAQYWRARLPAALPVLALPAVGRRSPEPNHAGCSFDFQIPVQTAERLKALAERRGTTLYVLLLAAYQVLLCRFSGQDAVCVGSPVANRPRREFADLVGYFVNPLPLLADIAANPRFTDFLAQATDSVQRALTHQNYPLLRMVEDRSRTSGSPQLFQTLFTFQNAHLLDGFSPFVLANGHAQLQVGALALESYPLTLPYAQMDLSLILVQAKDGLQGRFEYSTELFDQASMARLADGLRALLDDISHHPECAVKQLAMADRAQLSTCLDHWNDTARRYAEPATIDALIEQQTRATPDATALIFGDIVLNYRELERRASLLAAHLQQRGIGVESRVAVCMERSVDMVVALYAILKAGAAYVPIDPSLPAVRVGLILDSAEPQLLLVASAQVLDAACATLVLDGFDWSSAPSAIIPHAGGARLAYIIYTSGSTGTPKGVMNSHEGIRNRLAWMQQAYPLTAADRVLQKTPFGFDVSVWEFFWPLMYGASLVVAKPGGHQDPEYLADLIAQRGVTTLHFVPSMLSQFLAHLEQGAQTALTSLRRVICSGEELPLALQQSFFRALPRVELHNLYGPTEAAVDVSFWACESAQMRGVVPIGRPIANTRLHILDADFQPVPPGVTGELFIAGINLARGYVGRPDLSAERFLPDPFDATGARMYRTGDLARYRADGAIEYLGRTDFQLKLRGLRIELGEIEATLLRLNLARDVVVVAREFAGGDMRLVAYLAGGDRDDSFAKRALAAEIPEYMVPSHFVFLEQLPLNVNGKVDRGALPAPVENRTRELDAPLAGIEATLARLWETLLDVPGVGRDSNFFELGGHSLLATRLAARIRSAFGIKMTLADVFKTPQLAAMAARIGTGTAASAAPIAAAPPTARPALSRAQQRLWFLEQMEPRSPAYLVPIVLSLQGPIDAAGIAQALTRLQQRHAILRTLFCAHEGVAYQQIQDSAEAQLEVVDLRAWPTAQREREVMDREETADRTGFDLARELPMRATLLQTGEQDAMLLLTLHHIVTDGHSIALLLSDLCALYEQEQAAPLTLQYVDYAHWDGRTRDGALQRRQLDYWKSQLDGVAPLSTLPCDFIRPQRRRFRGASLPFALQESLAHDLAEYSRREGSTLSTVMLAAFQILLARHTGSADIVVGMPVSLRDQPELAPLIGFFVNTVAIRSHIALSATFTQSLAQVNGTVTEALEAKDVLFEEVVELLQPERSLSHNPLVQIMFSFQEAAQRQWQAGPMTCVLQPYQSVVAKFDLTVVVEQDGERLAGYIEYDTDLYRETTVARLIDHYQVLLESLVAAPSKPLVQLDWVAPQEQQAVRASLAPQPADYPRQASVAELFARQAALHPHAPALRYLGVDISYSQLAQRANTAASVLREHGVVPGMHVGLRLARSPELIISLLAILKNGAVYVPIDSAMPLARQRFIIDDAAITVMIAGSDWQADAAPACRIVDVDQLVQERESASWQDVATEAGAPAYIMYTSGSTGLPKGVLVPHRGVTRLLFGANYVQLEHGKRVLHAASTAFDASTFEIWGALLHGGVCVIYPDAVPTAAGLRATIADDGVDTMWLTASLFHSVVDDDPRCLMGLTQLLVGGDTVSKKHVKRVYEQDPSVTVINGYGPTESTTFACCYPIPRESMIDASPSISLGRAIANTSLYILDADQQPVPVGVAGELCIGGDGLALAYLGQAALTAEKFIPDPFGTVPGARLYRSGDLVRCDDRGLIEFIGRGDNQVKVRGFRIELDEVEAHLRSLANVRAAAVLVHGEAHHKALVAFVQLDPGSVADSRSLLQQLRAALPDYMVPARVTILEQMPLTANGKLDRRALPAPTLAEAGAAYLAPRNGTEQTIADIWQEVLGVARVGVHDEFFELGGHSLLATRIAARIEATFGIALPVRALFEHAQLGDLADYVAACAPAGMRTRQAAPVRAERSGDLPLSFAQQRLYFLEQLEGANPLYSMVAALRLTGDFDSEAYASALQQLIARHETLRTRFVLIDGVPTQQILDRAGIAVDHNAIDGSAPDANQQLQTFIDAEARTPFDLACAPLLRSRVIKLGAREHVTVLSMHHIISDGWSVGVLMRELAECYDAARERRAACLPELPLQYLDFARWQQDSDDHAGLAYWQNKLRGLPPLLDLPTDRPRPPVRSYRGATIAFRLPSELAEGVRALARREGASTFMALLAVYNALLARYSGQSDIAVGFPSANRALPEFEGVVGFFANTLVLRTEVQPDMSLRTLLQQVRATSLEAQVHQAVPFEQLVETLNPERSLSYSPLFQAMFAFQNTEQQQWRLGELAVEPLDVDTGYAKFDLTLSVAESGDAIGGVLEYDTALFDRTSMQRWLGHYQQLLAGALREPGRALDQIDIMTPEERALALYGVNCAARLPYPAACLHELVARQAASTPERIALYCGDESTTYRELDARVNRLANHLIAQGIGPATRVAVYLHRRADLVVTLLAILKTGAAYVPMDPAYPGARTQDILGEAQVALLVTQRSLADQLASSAPNPPCPLLWLDESGPALDACSDSAPAVRIDPQDPAYFIFTSGSTGRPKGIVLTHANAVAMVGWAQQVYSPEDLAVTLACTSICFDLSIYELFVPLISGCAILLVDDALALPHASRRERVTLINTVPSAMAALLDMDAVPDNVRVINLAGEPLPLALVQACYEKTNAGRVYNLYGPSEDTTYSTFALIPRDQDGKPGIGHPIANSSAYVLDRHFNPVPFSMVGELYLGGAGVTQGYWQRPDLSAERYLPHPFSDLPGARMYRTGDWVRMRADGMLEYIGRIDHQVKLHGFRIELGEIEHCLRRCEGVGAALVAIRSDRTGSERLVAYVVLDQGIDGASVRRQLEAYLPHYMVPSVVLELASMPLLPNGKIDRKALPEPDTGAGTIADDYVAPRSQTEVQLAEIWRALLGRGSIGVHENFFQIGGHSLLATQISVRVKAAFGVDLPLRAIFQGATIAALADQIETILWARSGAAPAAGASTSAIEEGTL